MLGLHEHYSTLSTDKQMNWWHSIMQTNNYSNCIVNHDAHRQWRITRLNSSNICTQIKCNFVGEIVKQTQDVGTFKYKSPAIVYISCRSAKFTRVWKFNKNSRYWLDIVNTSNCQPWARVDPGGDWNLELYFFLPKSWEVVNKMASDKLNCYTCPLDLPIVFPMQCW